jgi:hypothetical protein
MRAQVELPQLAPESMVSGNSLNWDSLSRGAFGGALAPDCE